MMETSVCPIFLHDIISWSKEGAAAFYGLVVKRITHLAHFICLRQVPTDIYIHGPTQDVDLDFFLLALWLSVYISMFLLSSLTFYAHFCLSCVCVWPTRRERQFFRS